MGNRIFKSNKVEVADECFICWNKIVENTYFKCIYCDIKLHCDCEKKYRSDKSFSRCPHCQRIGSICSIK